MAAEFISLPEKPEARQETIQRVAGALAAGAIVAFPTETVYGIGASAALASSVERLRQIKQAPARQPFTVHIGRRSDCEAFVPRMTPQARAFMNKGWPGPLTLIFPVDDPHQALARPVLSDAGAASIYCDRSVGVRFPDHAVAASLLALAGVPIIASSANRKAEPPALTAETVRQRLGDDVDVVLDGGPARYGKISTIVALNGTGYRVLRAGVWDERTVRRLATINVLFVCTGNTCRSPIAEGVFRNMLANRVGCPEADLAARGWAVRSAGTMALEGGRAAREAVEVCRRRGLDISIHRVRGLSPELLHWADYIFTMGRQHLDVIRAVSPADAAKAVPLDAGGDIADPIGGSIDDYEAVAARITQALKKRIEEVCP